MAGLFEFLRTMGNNGLANYLANRERRNALNRYGLFMTNPGYAAPVRDYDMFAPGEINEIRAIINKEEPDFFYNITRDKNGNIKNRIPITGSNQVEKRIREALDPSSTEFAPSAKDRINKAIEARQNAYDARNAPHREAYQRYATWNNGKRLAGTDMTWNSELAQQKANTFKRWLKGGGLVDPLLLAYTLYDADDKEQAFKDYTSLSSLLGAAGTGATLGTLGSLVTGGGLGWGALSGAVGSAAPIAALAGGYLLGNEIDKATGASSKIANAAWNLMHDDEAERAESDRKAAANPEVVNAKKFLNIRNNLVDKYGLSKVQANEITNRVMAGTSVEQALQNAGIVIPGAEKTPVEQNSVTPEKAKATPSGVNYLDTVSSTQVPSANNAQNVETLPNSRLRVYDRDGKFIRYI